MDRDSTFTIRIDRRLALVVGLTLLVALAYIALPDGAQAQEAQEDYKDKFKIADAQSGIAIAASSDGKFVYVAGPRGVIASDDFGKTGTWVQTVKLK